MNEDQAAPEPKKTSSDLYDRIQGLVAVLEKEPRFALAQVIAGDALARAFHFHGWEAVENAEADILKRVRDWRENARLRAFGRRVDRAIKQLESGAPKKRRRKAKRSTAK